MTALYTWDVFSTLDGYGSYGPLGDWGGYWSKHGPELLAHRASLFDPEPRMVFGATTFRENAAIMVSGDDPFTEHEWNVRTMRAPATVISSTLTDTLGWPNATIVSGDAVDLVSRLKNESDVPIRSQASLTLNWALMAAGLVDRLQVTIFPVISGRTGTSPSWPGWETTTYSCLRAARSTVARRSLSTGRAFTNGPAVLWRSDVHASAWQRGSQ